MVRGIDADPEPQRHAKWEFLCATYRPAMLGYARRLLRRGLGAEPSEEDVEDVVQGFLVSCVEKRWLSRADPAVGKFRAFLQALLKRHACNWLDHKNARKRRPPAGTRHLPADDLPDSVAPATESPDDEEFDRDWVRASVEAALGRLRARNAKYAGVIDDLLDDGERRPRAPLSSKERNLRHHARSAFRREFEEVLRATVVLDAQAPEEWAAIAAHLP